MKISVSLPGTDILFLDEYARQSGLDARSAAVHKAVSLLRTEDLSASYEAAWADCADGDADAWETAAADA
jgi:hypothetical protein